MAVGAIVAIESLALFGERQIDGKGIDRRRKTPQQIFRQGVDAQIRVRAEADRQFRGEVAIDGQRNITVPLSPAIDEPGVIA